MFSILQTAEVTRCLHLDAALLDLLERIPEGRVTTFGDLAFALGDPIAARWVGHFVLHHVHLPGCSCHRVVRMDGAIGGYIGGSPQDKARRLRDEGIDVAEGRVALGPVRFTDFESFRPLGRLAEIQRDLTLAARISRRRIVPRTIAGVDVSYRGPSRGVAAYVEVDVATGDTVRTLLHEGETPFPYITSYLAFRELPLLIGLMEKVVSSGGPAPLVLVDGSGMLHQRHAGIATHLGVLFDVPTIGVTKKLLCGSAEVKRMEPDESRPVIWEGREIGRALRPSVRSRRPLYVSPGHCVDVPFCEIAVRRVLLGRRLPEPIYQADRHSRAHARRMPPEGEA